MKKLLEIQDQYIAALKQEVSKPIELLTAAKHAMGNSLSDCKRCTSKKPCNYCIAWAKVWDDIADYLERQRKRQYYHNKKKSQVEPVEESALQCKQCGGDRLPGHRYCQKCAEHRKTMTHRQAQSRYWRKQ